MFVVALKIFDFKRLVLKLYFLSFIGSIKETKRFDTSFL
jgi:hypothetical protein